MGESNNLGQIAALWIGSNAPQNKRLIWYDTVEQTHKTFDSSTSTWRVLNPQIVKNTDLATLRLISDNTGLSVGDFYYLTDVGSLAIAIAITKVWYVDSFGNYIVNDLSASIIAHVNSNNLLIDGSTGVWNNATGKLEFKFNTMSDASQLDGDKDHIVLRHKNENSSWSWFKVGLKKIISTVSDNYIVWNKGLYFDFKSALNSKKDVAGGVISWETRNSDLNNISNEMNSVRQIVNENYTFLKQYIDDEFESFESEINQQVSEFKSSVNQNINSFENAIAGRINSIENSLSSYALRSELSSYALRSELSSYATLTKLEDYALLTELNNYLPLSGGTIVASNEGYYLDLYGDGLTLGHSNGVASFNLTTDSENKGRILRLTASGFEMNCSIEATGSATAVSFIKKDGTSSQFLKADGSVDNTQYLPTGAGGTVTGSIVATSFVKTDSSDDYFLLGGGGTVQKSDYVTKTEFSGAIEIINSSISERVTNSALTNTLSSYVTNSALTNTLSSYVTNSALTNTLSSYMPKEPNVINMSGAGFLKITSSEISLGSLNTYITSIDSYIYIRPGLGVGGDLNVSGISRAAQHIDTSDERLKNILSDVRLSVEDIAKAPSVRFTWRDNVGDRKAHAGTIAQYWDNILPDVVTENNDNYLAMNYGAAALISVVI